MASVDTGTNNPNDPNNPNNAPENVSQPGGDVSQPATTGGAGGVTATGSGNVTGKVVGTANPSQPFQNISSYLSANAQGGQQLAGQVAGTVSQPINQAQTGITNAATDFTKSVNAGYTPENKDLISAVSSNPAYVVAQNPENVTNFQAQLNNRYTGPTDFAQEPGYADLQAKIAQAQAQAANTQNESGIQTLLKGVEGPTTAGINKLDSLLLNVDPNNLKTIQDAGKGAGDLLPSLNQTTADQNALAGTGQTTAQQTAAAALAALQSAHGKVGSNLTSEQETIQGIVNEYNKSVGVINPVVQTISSAISDFLSKNPNIKLDQASDPLAALQNIANIVMPELATYASPEDYAQIAALTQLGDANVAGLPISSATSGQAQTFNIPKQLQDAIGKAPDVQAALQQQLGGFGTQLNTAAKRFSDAEEMAYDVGTLSEPYRAAQIAVENGQKQIASLQQQLTSDAINHNKQTQDALQYQINKANAKLATDKASLQDLQGKISAEEGKLGVPFANWQGWDAVAPIARELQWVNSTGSQYKDLVDLINGELGKLGQVGAPTLSYGPEAMAAPVPGMPIGQVNKDIANAVSTGVGAGIPAATGLGLLSGTVPTTAAGLASAAPGAVAGQIPAAGLTALQSAGPAALAAYGTSNIVQNELANPIQGGLMTLGNMGLTLATMSLPPQIFLSIGKDIGKVIDSIGNFFKGLF